MSKTKKFAARIAMVAGVATLFVASVFADSRPSDETSWRERKRDEVRRDGGRDRDWDRRGDDSRNGRDRDRYENDGRNRDRYERDRNNRYDRDRNDRRPYYANGRVSRVDRYRDGYRVWVGGARYPFHVPSRYYDRDRFRIGVVINIGGIFNNDGYYDYYDRARYSSRGDLRGVVETVDYRRDSFVIRNDATGHYVTVVSRESLRRLRAGDYVEVEGDWARRGVFRAHDVDILDRY